MRVRSEGPGRRRRLEASDRIEHAFLTPANMLERSSVTEQFSTFIELADERFKRWVPDGRLVRSMAAMRSRLKQEPDTEAAQFWSLYWHRRWGEARARASSSDNPSSGKTSSATTSLPYAHLAAFVQEACYWAAQKTARFATSRFTWVDYFQLAMARLDTVLKSFSSERGSRLETYAHVTFKNLIRETLRQRKEIDICSDWALLLRLSQKRLIESLRAAGDVQTDETILVWRCFKAVYDPALHSTRQLEQADAEIWSAIAAEYNHQCLTLSPAPANLDTSTLRKTLRHCAAAARAYLYPKAASLNATRLDEGELQDTLASPDADSLLEAMVTAEEIAVRQRQQQQLDQVLQAALGQLSDEAQKILALYYQDNRTQQQIANRLDVKQYTVSRRLSKAREALLKNVADWSKETLHISLTPDLLNSINTVLEEWLTRYYGAGGMDSALEDSWS